MMMTHAVGVTTPPTIHLLATLERWDEITTTLIVAVAAAPHDAALWGQLGRAMRALGNADAAVRRAQMGV